MTSTYTDLFREGVASTRTEHWIWRVFLAHPDWTAPGVTDIFSIQTFASEGPHDLHDVAENVHRFIHASRGAGFTVTVTREVHTTTTTDLA